MRLFFLEKSMKTAFVLGNGRSRIGLELDKLRPLGKIYGCNALYRDFSPDMLIATDPGISSEIESSGYPEHHEFYTRKPGIESYSKKIELNFGFSSGPIAVTYAAAHGHDLIYLLGFDFKGIDGKFNNVYADTVNYKQSNAKETYWGNWENQLLTIMRDQYPNKKYIRVLGDKKFSSSILSGLKNYSEINIFSFLDKLD